jgi:hypothetical protein
MKESDITFLRRQAEVCVSLSRATFDLTVAGRLRAMADDFRARALRCEDEITPLPAHFAGHNGSTNGKIDRG